MRRTVASLIVIFTLGAFTLLAQAPGRWITNKFAPLPAPAEEYTAVTANNRLYLIGGNRGGSPQWPRTVLEYDLATDKWTAKKQVPFSGDHMAAASAGDKVYVFGGQAEAGIKQPLNTAWEYDPATDAWKPLAPMPAGRTAAVAVEVHFASIGQPDVAVPLPVAERRQFDVAHRFDFGHLAHGIHETGEALEPLAIDFRRRVDAARRRSG